MSFYALWIAVFFIEVAAIALVVFLDWRTTKHLLRSELSNPFLFNGPGQS